MIASLFFLFLCSFFLVEPRRSNENSFRSIKANFLFRIVYFARRYRLKRAWDGSANTEVVFSDCRAAGYKNISLLG